MPYDPDNDYNSPWPRKSDTFFASADDGIHNACINWLPDAWDAYAIGYRRAGDLLVEYVIDHHRYQDTLVYPIVFNYRQYIELRLKELIRVGRRLVNRPEPFRRTHNLWDLWSICRDLIAEIETHGSQDDLEAVGEAIDQFCMVDVGSDRFRYPEDRDGNPSIPESVRYINLRQLRDAMGRLAAFFDAVSTMCSAYLNNKYEMEQGG